MKLRISGGFLKNRYVTLPQKSADFRPSKEVVRQAVFQKIRHIVPDAVAADLCAGSGICGFEMISRGAAAVYFVEARQDRCAAIRDSAALFHVASACIVIRADIRQFVENCTVSFDCIYYDPPYDWEIGPQLIRPIASLLNPAGMLIVEQSKEKPLPEHHSIFDGYLTQTRRFGKTMIYYIERL